MAKQRDIMVWYGERSQWVLNPRICPLGIGRMYFLMCQILSVLSCVLLLMKHHERFFGFSRRSSSGASIPTWLSTPGPVYLKRQVRTSKMEPLVNEVGLLQANTRYAHVRYPDGWETTVATNTLHLRAGREKSILNRHLNMLRNQQRTCPLMRPIHNCKWCRCIM